MISPLSLLKYNTILIATTNTKNVIYNTSATLTVFHTFLLNKLTFLSVSSIQLTPILAIFQSYIEYQFFTFVFLITFIRTTMILIIFFQGYYRPAKITESIQLYDFVVSGIAKIFLFFYWESHS